MFWKNKKNTKSSESSSKNWWSGSSEKKQGNLDSFPSEDNVSEYYLSIFEQFRCVLPEGVELEGDIDLPANSMIAGSVLGNVTSSARLMISPLAKISGSLSCEHLMNFGKIEGQINADKVTIYPKANVTAELICKSVKIGGNAQLNGPCSIGDKK